MLRCCVNSHGIAKSVIRTVFTSFNQQKSILRVNAKVFENVMSWHVFAEGQE